MPHEPTTSQNVSKSPTYVIRCTIICYPEILDKPTVVPRSRQARTWFEEDSSRHLNGNGALHVTPRALWADAQCCCLVLCVTIMEPKEASESNHQQCLNPCTGTGAGHPEQIRQNPRSRGAPEGHFLEAARPISSASNAFRVEQNAGITLWCEHAPPRGGAANLLSWS